MACISVSCFHLAAEQAARQGGSSLDLRDLAVISQCNCTPGDLERMERIIYSKLNVAQEGFPLTPLSFLRIYHELFLASGKFTSNMLEWAVISLAIPGWYMIFVVRFGAGVQGDPGGWFPRRRYLAMPRKRRVRRDLRQLPTQCRCLSCSVHAAPSRARGVACGAGLRRARPLSSVRRPVAENIKGKSTSSLPSFIDALSTSRVPPRGQLSCVAIVNSLLSPT